MRTVASAGPLGVAFCGAGMVSELHAAAIRASDRLSLLGLFDPDERLAAQRARDWGCRAYASYDDLLGDAGVGAVLILSPSASHASDAIRALESERHVLIEKPIAADLQELAAIRGAAEASGCVCFPGHNYAYMPEFERLRSMVAEGRFGQIRLVAIMFAIAHDESVAAHYDGVVRLVLPHHLYLAHALLGVPSAVAGGTTSPGWKDLEREDQAWLVLEYEPQTTAMLFASLAVDDDSGEPWSFVIKVVGTSGSGTVSWRSVVCETPGGSHRRGWAIYEDSYRRELDAFADAVEGRAGQIRSTIDDAVQVEKILEAAELAIRRRVTVDL